MLDSQVKSFDFKFLAWLLTQNLTTDLIRGRDNLWVRTLQCEAKHPALLFPPSNNRGLHGRVRFYDKTDHVKQRIYFFYNIYCYVFDWPVHRLEVPWVDQINWISFFFLTKISYITTRHNNTATGAEKIKRLFHPIVINQYHSHYPGRGHLHEIYESNFLSDSWSDWVLSQHAMVNCLLLVRKNQFVLHWAKVKRLNSLRNEPNQQFKLPAILYYYIQ